MAVDDVLPYGAFSAVARELGMSAEIVRQAWVYAPRPGMTAARAEAAGREARGNGALISDNPFVVPDYRAAWARGWSGA